jgi:hypothetical protein
MNQIYNQFMLKINLKSNFNLIGYGLQNMLNKVAFFVFTLMCISSVKQVSAQNIPNSGFESWTNGLPNGWFDGGLTSIGIPCIVKSTDAQSGSFALKIKVDNNKGEPISGSVFTNNLRGIATNLKPAYLNGFIKTNISVTDSITVGAFFYKDKIENGEIGAGFVYSTTNRPSWTAFYIPILYGPTFIPDSFLMFMGLTSIDTSSYIMFDDLSFSNTPNGVLLGQMPTGLVYKEKQQLNASVFPNPASNELEVIMNLENNNNLSFSFFDIAGRKCKTIGNFGLQGSNHFKISIDDLANGVYYLNISSNEGSVSRKVVISR